MGKRSNFDRERLDFYPTPFEAVEPLQPFLPRGVRFCEPCAGDGTLINHLERLGHECVSAYDVEPQDRERIVALDATWLSPRDVENVDFIITNPPWERPVLHQIIERCAGLRPTWLLFDADWLFTKQAARHLEICRMVVAVGRVKWIADSDSTGKDNACWYLFDTSNRFGAATFFYGRQG